MDFDEIEEEKKAVYEMDDDPAHDVTRDNVLAALNRGIDYQRFSISSLI